MSLYETHMQSYSGSGGVASTSKWTASALSVLACSPCWPQLGFLLVQGAQLMSQFGINVPSGIPVTKLEEVGPAAQRMANDQGEVRPNSKTCLLCLLNIASSMSVSAV